MMTIEVMVKKEMGDRYPDDQRGVCMENLIYNEISVPGFREYL
jgi:hypothetical protein